MSFPLFFGPLTAEVQQGVRWPRSLVVAGDSSTLKSSLLLKYAYNAALRGCTSLFFTKQRLDAAASFPRVKEDLVDEVLERIRFKYVRETADIRFAPDRTPSRRFSRSVEAICMLDFCCNPHGLM